MKIRLSYLLDRKDLARQPKELREICEKIFYTGKGLRSQMVSLVAGALGLSPKDKLFLSRIIEYIHNSSLLHDDFIDHSLVRRNRKTAWREFSPSQAVLAGDYLLAKVSIYLAEKNNSLLVKKTAEVICQLAEGEFLQRELMDFKSKDLKKRDRVGELKTASLFKWCLQAPFIYKKRTEGRLFSLLDKIGYFMGLLFQRSDDLIDFAVRDWDNKAHFSDFKQKQFNSFACFLLKGESSLKESQLKMIRSRTALKKLFPNFKEKVQAFDNINSSLITKAEKNIGQLKSFLSKTEQNLILDLKEWVYFLYWRQKKLEKSKKKL